MLAKCIELLFGILFLVCEKNLNKRMMSDIILYSICQVIYGPFTFPRDILQLLCYFNQLSKAYGLDL
jgi:hypothetical protein